jgi:ankyrin repeat protein
MDAPADLIRQLLEELPVLAYETNGISPLGAAILNVNLECVRALLEHAPNLAYASDEGVLNSFLMATYNGFVPIAEEIFRVCPDAAYANDEKGQNALHLAVLHDQTDFVNYILRTPKLHRLINQPDFNGNLPLHLAAELCAPKFLRLLLNYKRHDYTAPNSGNKNAVDIISLKGMRGTKTLKWVQFLLIVLN